MPEASIEAIISQAKTEERKHGWLAAADCYAMAASVVSAEDHFELAGLFESEGYASYRSAMQAENNEQFKTRCGRTVKCYEKASQHYLKSDEPGQKPRMIRCAAMIAYMNYWLESDVAKKRVHANECWRLTKRALETFEEMGEVFEFRKTYNQLVDSAFFTFFLEWDFCVRERIAKEAMDFGERAIKMLSKSADVYEQAKIHAKALVCITVFAYNFLDVSDRERE